MKSKFTIFFLLLTLATVSFSYSQHRLKFRKSKVQYWDPVSKQWTGWPTDFTYFDEDEKPVLKFTSLSDGSYLIGMWLEGEYSSFKVSYSTYRSDDECYVYEDGAGDQVWTCGSPMSSLAKNGWPSNKVQVYFWFFSDDLAMVWE